jgi:hypothetical protein
VPAGQLASQVAILANRLGTNHEAHEGHEEKSIPS